MTNNTNNTSTSTNATAYIAELMAAAELAAAWSSAAADLGDLDAAATHRASQPAAAALTAVEAAWATSPALMLASMKRGHADLVAAAEAAAAEPTAEDWADYGAHLPERTIEDDSDEPAGLTSCTVYDTIDGDGQTYATVRIEHNGRAIAATVTWPHADPADWGWADGDDSWYRTSELADTVDMVPDELIKRVSAAIYDAQHAAKVAA